MVYVRNKRVKGIDYAYLVKSEWDAASKSPRQQTIKYLGRSADVELEDIPPQYREDPKIVSFLSEHSPKDLKKKRALVERLRDRLYDSLASGSIDGACRLYDESKDVLSLEGFYDKILRPVMHDIGVKWDTKQIDVAMEHVCTNTAYGLVAIIEDRIAKKQNLEKVLMCSPDGEMHALGASVISSVLKSKGYRVFNAAPSAPADQVVGYIGDLEPDLIMVSVTLPENLRAAERLVRRIESKSRAKIVVGGLALASGKGSFGSATVLRPQENSLEDVLRLVRSLTR